MDYTERCYYCNNPINSIFGYCKDECHIVTGDIKVCNNLIKDKCLPFHPIGKMLYAIEEDMSDLANKNKKAFRIIMSSDFTKFDFIKSKIIESIYKMNIENKVVSFFDDDILIKNIIEDRNQDIKSNILAKLSIYLEYNNICKKFVKKVISFFDKFKKILTFNESFNKRNIEITILKDNEIVKFKLPKNFGNKNKSSTNLSSNHLLYT